MNLPSAFESNNLHGSSTALTLHDLQQNTPYQQNTTFVEYADLPKCLTNSDNLSLTQRYWESAKPGHTCNWKECGLPGLTAPYHGDKWEVRIYPNPPFLIIIIIIL